MFERRFELFKLMGFAVHLTREQEQVKGRPGIDRDQPVSQLKEQELAGYYGMPFYRPTRLGGGAEAGAEAVRTRTATTEVERGEDRQGGRTLACGAGQQQKKTLYNKEVRRVAQLTQSSELYDRRHRWRLGIPS